MSTAPIPDAAGYLACLAGLPRMTSHRLESMLAHHDPALAVEVAAGRRPADGPIATLLRRDAVVRGGWRDGVRERPPELLEELLAASETTVVRAGDAAYPRQLLDDPRRPPVLFLRGHPAALHRRRVGIVGTRNATHQGRETAARLGFELASVGVAVVSGLALGVDGAAHRGALAAEAAAPVAIVGSGPDVVYPKAHRRLWHDVAQAGLLMSEWPPGTSPDGFRFPLRNRLIAALSEVLVVVESRARGGSLTTAREAAERGVEVFAVPGALGAPASEGTNRLLADGAAPFTETADILMALGLDGRRAGVRRIDTRPRPNGREHEVLAECQRQPMTVDSIVESLGFAVADAALTLARLERSGWVREVSGWFEACDEYADLS